MAKTNKVVTDIFGNEVTHYGCATIQDACELGGVQTPSNSNKLVTIGDVLNKHPYNVGLVDNPNVEYSEDEQAVAYDDLRVQDWIELPMGNELQKFGVLRLRDTMAASALSGNSSNSEYLTRSSLNIGTCIIDTNNTSLVPGYIKVQVSDMASQYIANPDRRGYEIVLQNFLSNLYDESSLEIKSITLKDTVNSTDATSGSDYSTNSDASEFNIPSSQKRIVVENGQ
jgi:hypothetical protein